MCFAMFAAPVADQISAVSGVFSERRRTIFRKSVLRFRLSVFVSRFIVLRTSLLGKTEQRISGMPSR